MNSTDADRLAASGTRVVENARTRFWAIRSRGRPGGERAEQERRDGGATDDALQGSARRGSVGRGLGLVILVLEPHVMFGL